MGSLFLGPDEMAKKDDDLKLAKGSQQWSPATMSRRRTIKRVLIALLIGLCIIIFIRNIPTDVPIRDRRRPTYQHNPINLAPRPKPVSNEASAVKAEPVAGSNQAVTSKPMANPPANSPAKPEREKNTEKAESEASPPAQKKYDGPLKFLKLATSLQAIASTRGQAQINKNVLFAASSLKSASTLLPMACKMGYELKNYVHFAYLGRSDIELDELRAVNGIDESCDVIFHGKLGNLMVSYYVPVYADS
jgi:hypothetical protein